MGYIETKAWHQKGHANFIDEGQLERLSCGCHRAYGKKNIFPRDSSRPTLWPGCARDRRDDRNASRASARLRDWRERVEKAERLAGRHADRRRGILYIRAPVTWIPRETVDSYCRENRNFRMFIGRVRNLSEEN
jgi:hypothetical protein